MVIKRGILQALGVAFYCSLVGLVMWKANEIFGRMNPYLGPVAFLMMFSVSALICGLLVFYKPYKLFSADKKKEAIDVVIATAASLFVLLLILFATLYFFK